MRISPLASSGSESQDYPIPRDPVAIPRDSGDLGLPSDRLGLLPYFLILSPF
jgi:hypothetical protein